MIIGIFLGLSLAVLVTSISLFILKLSGVISPVSGAVIGGGVQSPLLLIVAGVISLIATYMLMKTLEHRHHIED